MPSQLDLALAWRRTKLDLQTNRVFVRTPYEIELVEENLDGWLDQLHCKIVAGYHPNSAPIADAPKGNGAIRPAAILSLEDRTVYTAVVGALLPKIYAGLKWAQGTVDFSYQFSENLGRVHWLKNRFLNWRRFRRVQTDRLSGDGVSHVVFTDLTGFYENVDLGILMSALRGLGCDSTTVQIFSKFVFVGGRLSLGVAFRKAFLSCHHDGFKIRRNEFSLARACAIAAATSPGGSFSRQCWVFACARSTALSHLPSSAAAFSSALVSLLFGLRIEQASTRQLRDLRGIRDQRFDFFHRIPVLIRQAAGAER